MNIAKFLRTAFLQNTSGSYFLKACFLYPLQVLQVLCQNSAVLTSVHVSPLNLDDLQKIYFLDKPA